MSHLHELLQELCPDGIEWVKLGEICEIETGKLNANAATKDGLYAFFTTAKEVSRINTYRWDTEALLVAGNANIGEVKHYIGKFEAYQRTYVLTHFNNKINPRFLHHVLSNSLKIYLDKHKKEAAMTYIVLSTLENFSIPLPPLPIQREIVRILDTFSELTSELTAELTAELALRKKQYAFYRDKLLTFDESVERVKLGELEASGVLALGRGNVISKKELQNNPGNYPVYSSSAMGDGEIGRYGNYMFDDERITWSIDGGGKFFYRNGIRYSVTNVGGWIKVNSASLNTKFLYYVLSSQWENQKFDYVRKAHPSVIKDIYDIPLPPLSEQQRIVAILDRFDTLCNDLTDGIPAEIEARKKQYAYYRDLLLRFEKAA